MRKLSLFLIFIANFATAQNQRFAYEYKFITDSTNKENVTKELMYLDITKDGSKFYSREVYVSDSLQKEEVERQVGSHNITIKTISTGKVNYKIYKNYPDYKVFLSNKMGIDSYRVADDRIFNRKISPEKEKISEFMAQKATAELYGRKWIAWFTSEIPLQEGPYKFHGLPGLIVRISDASNSHVFELKAATKFKKESDDNIDSYGEEKSIDIIQNQYKKLYLDFRNDPAKSLKQIVASGGTITFTDASGNNISVADMIRKREKSAKENNLKNNNLLELDLLK